jgi:uncharacterized protein
MAEIKKPIVNSFCWIELNTSDPAAARKFYGELFGWKMNEMEMPSFGSYTMAMLGENTVAGMMKLADEAKKMGAPPHWLSYVAVDSAEKAAEKVKSLGGKVLMGPMDLKGPGIMAVAQDPTGGVFALWQSTAEMGTWLYQEKGSLCWNELATTNVDAAGKFYANLFDWKPEAMKMDAMTYTIFKSGEGQRGGMMPMPEMMKGAPTSWTAYFSVESADSTADKTKSLGGKVLNPPTDIPNIGRFAVLQDPQGAVFAVLQPA